MKVVIVGGGSAQWVPILVDDIVGAPCLAGAELVLEDVDAARLDRTREYAEHVAGLARSGVAVRATTDLRNALTGADFVVVCISTGGLDSMARDLDVSARFGVPLPVGDTVGPAGISRALRNVPVLVGIAREMERYCPNAWMLNVTNPLTALTRAVTRETGINAVGLCHEVQNCKFFLAQMLDASYADVVLRVTGVNHLPLVVGVEVAGRDRFGDLLAVAHERVDLDVPLPVLDRVFAQAVVTTGGGVTDAMRAPGWTKRRLRETQLLNYEVLRRFGAFPAADVDHTVEFVPGFLTADSEWGKAWGVEPVTVADRRGREATYAARLAEKLAATQPPRHRSTEMVVDVIEALVTGDAIELPLNIANAGQCPDLPADVVVESFCTVDADGIHGRDRIVAPPALAALLRRVSAAQQLTVDAALSGSRAALLAALFTDPLASALDHDRLVQLADAIVDATARWLPQFTAGAPQYVAVVTDRLLFVTQVAPYANGPAGVHGVLDQAAVGVGQIAELHGLAPQRVDDVRTLEPSDLNGARTLALFTIGETPWSADQRVTILDRVRAGGLAVLSIHSATDSCYGWDDYGRLVGARFDGHPWTQTFTADVLDASHPACEHLGDEWRWHDEVYQFRDLRSDAQVLLRVRDGELDLSAPGARPPVFGYPLAWCFAEGAGRVFSTSLGHFPGAWETPAYLQHLSGGLGWTLGAAA